MDVFLYTRRNSHALKMKINCPHGTQEFKLWKEVTQDNKNDVVNGKLQPLSFDVHLFVEHNFHI